MRDGSSACSRETRKGRKTPGGSYLVVRIYQERGDALDLRSGLAWRPSESSPPWIKALALPAELGREYEDSR